MATAVRVPSAATTGVRATARVTAVPCSAAVLSTTGAGMPGRKSRRRTIAIRVRAIPVRTVVTAVGARSIRTRARMPAAVSAATVPSPLRRLLPKTIATRAETADGERLTRTPIAGVEADSAIAIRTRHNRSAAWTRTTIAARCVASKVSPETVAHRNRRFRLRSRSARRREQ